MSIETMVIAHIIALKVNFKKKAAAKGKWGWGSSMSLSIYVMGFCDLPSFSLLMAECEESNVYGEQGKSKDKDAGWAMFLE